MSRAGEAAAEARRKASLAPDSYNFHLGPTAWEFGAGLDLEANDNIRFASGNRTSDLITRPQVNTRMVWPFSDKNSLNLALGAGYAVYALNPEFNRLFVSPGSDLSLDLYAGDLWINFHERLTITENAYEDPTVVDSADYSQLQNVSGLGATWDLNKLVITVGYDHVNYARVSGSGGLPDGDSDIFALSGGYRWKPETTLGLESGGGWIRYGGDNTALPEAVDWNLGAFAESQPMEYVKIRAAGGYTVYAPQTGGTKASSGEFTGIYARLGLTHRINRHIEYNLNLSRSISFGFFAGTIDMYTASFEARWHLFQKLSVGTGFEFEHGSQLLVGRESFDRFGPRLSLERPITLKVSGALRYQYYQRRSDLPGGDYEINLLTLSIMYRL